MIWGKVIGGLAGLALGHSPLGLLAGAIAGHWLDSYVGRRFGNPEAERRNLIFLTAVTCLSAKLAKVDGPVSRQEVDAFKAQFRFNDPDKARVAQLFDQAKQDPSGFEPFAQSLADNFAAEPFLLAEVFGALYRIATVDGGPNDAEQGFLQRVAQIFGVTFQANFEAPPRRASQGDDPYAVLNVTRSAPMSEIKAAWRRLSREHHPDNLIAKGVPDDYVALATRKMAAINAAYDQIRRDRGET